MIELSQLQQRIIAANENQVVVDPRTSSAFEIVRTDAFDQMDVRLGDDTARRDRERNGEADYSGRVNVCDDPILEIDERYARNRGGR